MNPPVQQLQLHLPGMHVVAFKDGQTIKQVFNKAGAEQSMLTQFFEKNRQDEKYRHLLYREFPENSQRKPISTGKSSKGMFSKLAE